MTGGQGQGEGQDRDEGEGGKEDGTPLFSGEEFEPQLLQLLAGSGGSALPLSLQRHRQTVHLSAEMLLLQMHLTLQATLERCKQNRVRNRNAEK